MYKKFLKRCLDLLLSLLVLTLLSPVFLVMIILGAILMGGNPFYTQARPGKNGEIFRLIKFRSMTNRKDAEGKLLPDAQRVTGYGRFIRAASLDELPEFLNIFIGDMAFIGPRPLLEEYLPYYTPEEMRRHEVLPGLTGLAQVSGRNGLSWEERFQLDVRYVDSLSFLLDLKIVFLTVKAVVCRSGVQVDTSKEEGNFAQIRRAQLQEKR
ncbi:MAG: sugar transferase [Oscillospiraceae bacterium]|nr:sugar transferase [Oscillospiraceae bacterium]